MKKRSSKCQAEQLQNIGVSMTPEELAEILVLPCVLEKTRQWGMTWDQLGIVVEIWRGYAREEAIRKLDAMLCPTVLPDYDSVMREAQ